MSQIDRRKFLRNTALGAAGVIASPLLKGWENVFARSIPNSTIRLYPHPWMPPMDFTYLTDQNEDPFKSGIKVDKSGIVLPDDVGKKRFGINTRWFVEDFGFIFLTADNGGQHYSLSEINGNGLSLNYEFAKSRVARNRNILKRYVQEGTKFSSEVNHITALSEELFEDASKRQSDGEKCADYADRALMYALHAGEKIEVERAKSEILRQMRKDVVHFGCESRQYVWIKSEDFTKRFPEVFDYATLTHYVWDSWYELFEPREGEYNWGIKDNIVNFLLDNNIKIEGRPLFWFHPTVTPDWLKNKSFSELKKYVDKHTTDLVTHYGDKVHEWEVINEYHDWANIFNHTPEQITEIVKQACNKTKEVNPKVVRILNNCCLWAEYAARGRMARMDATRPLRNARRFIEDLTTAEVDYDVLGIQIYYPYRDLSEIVRMVERFEKFNKPIYITEMGATSGPTNETVFNGQMKLPSAPYEWRRPWDEELQADWLEAVYTIYYSRPLIKTINWYDFADFRPFIVNGGVVREDGSPKMSFERLKSLLASWNRLPGAK
jgi:GH35 family endo-1,4-beta-xylanase